MSVTKPLLHFAAGTVAGILIISQLAFRNDTRKRETDNTPPQWHIPQTPTTMTFANEAVPLERWDIEERFDRELLFIYYQTSNIIFIKKTGEQVFPGD